MSTGLMVPVASRRPKPPNRASGDTHPDEPSFAPSCRNRPSDLARGVQL